jgi:hypothetical protein
MTTSAASDFDPLLACSQQAVIRLPLPLVESNVDYERTKRLLADMDELLRISGVEERFIMGSVAAEAERVGRQLSERRTARVQEFARRTLRCNIARLLSEESFRSFSVHLADSHLLRAFCGYDGLADQSPSKSTLQRMFEGTAESEIRGLVEHVVLRSSQVDGDGTPVLATAEPMSLAAAFLDSTCIELDIHYPTDWVLLRDLTRSIIQAVDVIRSHGLFCRMATPKNFIAQMNALCIQMTAASRRGGSKKKRKQVLRKMKKHVKTVCEHGQRHLARLERDRQSTELSERQAAHIADRLRHLLDLAPRVIKQAHERIIGERPIKNDEKLLSIYEPHASVYVRGKAGAECEFGIQCLIAESVDGLIMDWDVPGDRVIPDTKSLIPSIERMNAAYGQGAVEGVITDRGFTSRLNSKLLEDLGVEDYTLPRDPRELKARMRSRAYADLHRRRAQTEARIGIFKNCFVRRTVPAKGLENQRTHIAWAALAHNLWLIARVIDADRTRGDAAA